jgi:hypothetical protein
LAVLQPGLLEPPPNFVRAQVHVDAGMVSSIPAEGRGRAPTGHTWSKGCDDASRRLVCECREGMYAAIADVTVSGLTGTALFFPDVRRYKRQLRSYDRRWLLAFMPHKIYESPGGPFTCVPHLSSLFWTAAASAARTLSFSGDGRSVWQRKGRKVKSLLGWPLPLKVSRSHSKQPKQVACYYTP